MFLVLNNLSFVYLGSASWEEFVRKSELESENSTFKLRLVNYDHYHQIIKKYLNKTKETSPVSPTRARPQRHPPSGEKSSKLSCPEMGFGAFYMFGIYWLLGGFRRGPNCVTHIIHSHILCTVPPVCFWTNKTESKMSRVTGVRLHFAFCVCVCSTLWHCPPLAKQQRNDAVRRKSVRVLFFGTCVKLEERCEQKRKHL